MGSGLAGINRRDHRIEIRILFGIAGLKNPIGDFLNGDVYVDKKDFLVEQYFKYLGHFFRMNMTGVLRQ